MYMCIYICIYTYINIYTTQSAGAVEYTDCISVECPEYDTKQYDSNVPVMLELWGMLTTSSLPKLSGPLWPGVVAPDRVISMVPIELKGVLMQNLIF